MSICTVSMAIAMALAIATLTATVSAQQAPVPSCATKLTACAQFLNATTPPDSCCTPLKDAFTNDLSCLCKIFDNPAILKAFKIDLNKALQLPVHCGMPNSTTTACKTTAGAPTSPPPPSGAHGSSNRAWMGMPGLMGLLLVWWSILA